MNDIETSLKYLDEHCSCDQEVGYTCPECCISKTITKLKAANEVLMKGCEFYGDHMSWIGFYDKNAFPFETLVMGKIVYDDIAKVKEDPFLAGGERARQAIKKAKEIIKSDK